ncbi:MAG: sigma 54-interacting transcriptional regulator [Deltaproteobacteria bacterium]|nr:sigma 54-interacting transcriptional regulator [Deltaproteobacteria bacterium]
MKNNTLAVSEHQKIICDSLADGVFTVDMDSRITSFNRASEEITGIPRTEAIGKRCYEVFRASVCESGCLIRKSIATGKPVFDMPVYIVRADKKRIPISVTTALLKNEDGKIIGGVETFRDMTVVRELRKALTNRYSFDDIVSKNKKIHQLFAILPQIAKSGSTVLIEGSSGTGKELFANAIHRHSSKRNGPFVAVNCGALPDALIESELFGYKAGAFTDAKKDKPGRFALAQHGTIFLDEIGDISPAVQIRLLRVLEDKAYEPLGSTKSVQADARVITATHRNLNELVKDGRFREDLYFRINVMRLSLPILSERKEDIPLLVDHFIEKFNILKDRKIVGLTQRAMAAMLLYDWPGNVRELENAVEHGFVLSQGQTIRLHHLPAWVHPQNESVKSLTGLTLKEIEKNAIHQALLRNNWKKMATARELGIDKNTLRRKIKRLGIMEPS